jgi:hypothetical protein
LHILNKAKTNLILQTITTITAIKTTPATVTPPIGRELKSQTIVVMSSDWLGRSKSNYQYNSSDGRTFRSET